MSYIFLHLIFDKEFEPASVLRGEEQSLIDSCLCFRKIVLIKLVLKIKYYNIVYFYYFISTLYYIEKYIIF